MMGFAALSPSYGMAPLEAVMQFGIFDHLDDSGAPLGRHYEDRLKLIEAYDRAGFYAYHLAEHLPRRRGAAHPADQAWPDGLSAAALSPAAADR